MNPITLCFFGAALVSVRNRVGMSRYQLAKKTGFSDPYLNKLEHAKCEPRARTILLLGRGLGVPPGDLINEMDRLTKEYEETGIIPLLVREIADQATENKRKMERKRRNVLHAIETDARER